jgi:hypothetical protein
MLHGWDAENSGRQADTAGVRSAGVVHVAKGQNMMLAEVPSGCAVQ